MPRGHPAWGLDYDDIPVHVHGGWTYSSKDPPEVAPDDRWWIGFACCGVDDWIPGIDRLMPDLYRWLIAGEATFKTDDYVEMEIRKAAADLDAWQAALAADAEEDKP